MKKYFLFSCVCIALISISLLQSSCGKCSGCDEIYDTESVAIIASDTDINLSNTNAVLSLQLHENALSHKGDRNCRYKNLVICRGDKVDVESLELFCTQDLDLTVQYVVAGTNLIAIKGVVDTSASSSTFPGEGGNLPELHLKASGTFHPGRYHFVLKGRTTSNKVLEDFVFVNWY